MLQIYSRKENQSSIIEPEDTLKVSKIEEQGFYEMFSMSYDMKQANERSRYSGESFKIVRLGQDRR